MERRCVLNYYFEWDPVKARSNIQKHGISFECAAGVFKDPYALSIFDSEHSVSEDRWVTIGISNKGIIVICHTFREESNENCSIRIFSARKATHHEIAYYQEKLK
jgi:uncharacterized protein